MKSLTKTQKQQARFATKAIHAGNEPDPQTGSVSPPVYQTSTYAQQGVGDHKGYEYARTHNQTRERLEKNIAALEGAGHAIAFSSGMAATSAMASWEDRQSSMIFGSILWPPRMIRSLARPVSQT